MKSSLRRVIVIAAIAGLLLAGVIFLVAPAIQNRFVRGQMTDALNNARQLQIAIQMRVQDAQGSGEFPHGALPADLGVKSAREYFARLRLVEENYLSAADFAQIWGSGQLALTNAASDDPPGTALVIARSRPGERPWAGFAVFTSDGSGGVHLRASDAGSIRLPARIPAILPAE